MNEVSDTKVFHFIDKSDNKNIDNDISIVVALLPSVPVTSIIYCVLPHAVSSSVNVCNDRTPLTTFYAVNTN